MECRFIAGNLIYIWGIFQRARFDSWSQVVQNVRLEKILTSRVAQNGHIYGESSSPKPCFRLVKY